MKNNPSKFIWLILFFLLAGVIVYLYLQQNEAKNDFKRKITNYERRIDSLLNERDSLYKALALREQQYRNTADSLAVAFKEIQIEQTKTRTKYETRRDSIIVLPDNDIQRMVTDYIKRYGSLTER